MTSSHPAQDQAPGARVDRRQRRVRSARQRRQVAIRGGNLLRLDHFGERREPVLAQAARLEVLDGPSVESSQNRSVIWAGTPHWGQGMVSGMGALLTSRSSPSVAPWRQLRYQRGCALPGWASSAATHLICVSCVTVSQWVWPATQRPTCGSGVRRQGLEPRTHRLTSHGRSRNLRHGVAHSLLPGPALTSSLLRCGAMLIGAGSCGHPCIPEITVDRPEVITKQELQNPPAEQSASSSQARPRPRWIWAGFAVFPGGPRPAGATTGITLPTPLSPAEG